jgi:hypothetical protein
MLLSLRTYWKAHADMKRPWWKGKPLDGHHYFDAFK